MTRVEEYWLMSSYNERIDILNMLNIGVSGLQKEFWALLSFKQLNPVIRDKLIEYYNIEFERIR